MSLKRNPGDDREPDVPRFAAGRGGVGHFPGFRPRVQPLDAAHVPIPGSQIPAQARRREVMTSPHFAFQTIANVTGLPCQRLWSQARSTSTEPTEYPAPKEQIRPLSPAARSSEYLENAMIEPAEEVLA